MTDKPDGKKKRRTRFLALGIVILTIIALYMGSYYALERRSYYLPGDWSGGDIHFVARVVYRNHSDFKAVFFRPAHAIDRALRPSRWAPKDLTDASALAEERPYPQSPVAP